MKTLRFFPRLALLCALCLVAAAQAVAQTTTTASYVYEKVTSEDGLVAGDTYLIVNEENNAIMGYQKDNNRNGYISSDKDILTIADNTLRLITTKIATTTDNQSHAYELTLGGETGQWTLYDKVNEGYLYAASSSQNNLKTKANIDDNGKATITFSDGNATIKFNGDKTRNVIRFNQNKGSKLFSCYEEGKQKDVQLYRKKTATFSISKATYATLYLDEAFEMPEGVTGYTVTTENYKTIELNNLYTAGTPVPAQTALLIEGKEGEYTYNVMSYDAAAPTDNLLHGTTTDETTNVEGTAAYYKLAYDEEKNEVGFYYGAEGGVAFTNAANKAYLALPSQGGESPAMGFALTPHDDITAVKTLTAGSRAKGDRIYDLNGRSLTTLSGAQKGIYIVNGKKTFVK